MIRFIVARSVQVSADGDSTTEHRTVDIDVPTLEAWIGPGGGGWWLVGTEVLPALPFDGAKVCDHGVPLTRRCAPCAAAVAR